MTQIQRTLAEEAREDAETASGNADKAYAAVFRMTTDQYLKNKELDTMAKIAGYNGTAVTVIMNAP